MGAQTKGNTADPRQRQMVNEGTRTDQQRPQEQEVGIGNYERQQQRFNQRAEQQAMAERMQQQRAENTPTPGSGIAFGPGRSNRGDVDLRKLLQDPKVQQLMRRGN